MKAQGNCTISVAGYGTRSFYCTGVQYGINVVANQGASRNGQAFYPLKRTSGSFTLMLLFPNHRDYQNAAIWFANYATIMANGSDKLGPMRVQIPSSEFDKVAIVKSGIEFGDTMESVTYGMTLGFDGARDSLDPASALISSFITPKGVDTIGRYFFPATTPTGDASPNQTPWYLYNPGSSSSGQSNGGQPGVNGTIGNTGSTTPAPTTGTTGYTGNL